MDQLEDVLKQRVVDEAAALAALARLRRGGKDIRRLLDGRPVRRPGRPSDWPKEAMIEFVAAFFEYLTGRRAAVSGSIEDGGPFVRFLRGVLPLIDPSLKCPAPNTIIGVLKDWREFPRLTPEILWKDDDR